jgi:hypothetical protein
MMKPRLMIFAFLMLGLTFPGCAGSGTSNGESPKLLGETQIRAAIIDYESANPPSVGETPIKVIFVSLGHGKDNADPEPELFKAIPAGKVLVEPYSACDFQSDGITENRTGARGVLLQLGNVRWANDDRATVEGTTWAAKGLGAVNEYHVVKEQGRWLVKKRQSLGST